MPRFFFHLRNAYRSLQDCEGIAVADPEAARRQALATLRDFVQPSTGRVDPAWLGWLMQIADERGRCLYSIPFAEAPDIFAREQPVQPEEPPARTVVYLDIERVRRELMLVEHEVREHIRRTAALALRTRTEVTSLNQILRDTAAVRQRAQEVVTRSRSQHNDSNWAWGR